MTNNKKPQFDKKRPLSWSAISSFEWDKEEWYRKYVLGIPQNETKEMRFGKQFAQSIEDGTAPQILLDRLSPVKEHPFNVTFAGIPMVGYADAFDTLTQKIIDEVKTGKKPWDQKRVDNHGQLDMYVLFNYLTNRVHPEDMTLRLHWLPTQEGGDFGISFTDPLEVHTFETRRTMQQILQFGQRIKATYAEMQAYAKAHE